MLLPAAAAIKSLWPLANFRRKFICTSNCSSLKKGHPWGLACANGSVHEHSTAEPPLMAEDAPRSFGTCSCGGVGCCIGLTKESASQRCFGKVACTPLRSVSHHFKNATCGKVVPLTHEASSPCLLGTLGINADYVCIYTCV